MYQLLIYYQTRSTHRWRLLLIYPIAVYKFTIKKFSAGVLKILAVTFGISSVFERDLQIVAES